MTYLHIGNLRRDRLGLCICICTLQQGRMICTVYTLNQCTMKSTQSTVHRTGCCSELLCHRETLAFVSSWINTRQIPACHKAIFCDPPLAVRGTRYCRAWGKPSFEEEKNFVSRDRRWLSLLKLVIETCQHMGDFTQGDKILLKNLAIFSCPGQL